MSRNKWFAPVWWTNTTWARVVTIKSLHKRVSFNLTMNKVYTDESYSNHYLSLKVTSFGFKSSLLLGFISLFIFTIMFPSCKEQNTFSLQCYGLRTCDPRVKQINSNNGINKVLITWFQWWRRRNFFNLLPSTWISERVC